MNTKYKFTNAEGVTEEITLERWAWGVVYNDDTELRQFDADYGGRFHQFKEIDQERVKMFIIYRTDSDLKARIDIVVHPDMQLFYFYRRLILDNRNRKTSVYVYGWKNRITGAMTYNYILPDDRIVTADHDIADITAFNI